MNKPVRVKICAKCGFRNTENALVCAEDGAPLVNVSPVMDLDRDEEEVTTQFSPIPEDLTQLTENPDETVEPPVPRLILELKNTGDTYELKNGWIIGQEHATSKAHVRLARNIPGVNFVHREHCAFQTIRGNWYILPIKAHTAEFINPTTINNNPVEIGELKEIRHGDELGLSGLMFIVKIEQ